MFILITAILALLSTVVNALTLNTSSLLLPPPPTQNTTRLTIPFDRLCTAPRYGGGISAESCADALLQVDATDRRERVFAEREREGGRGVGVDVGLPRRWISRKFFGGFV